LSDEPNLEFEGKGVSLRIKGLKPLAQVSQYAADTIGIIGEPLGLIKDKLAAFRLNQVEASAIAMQRAKDIKADRGEVSEPISQKYLASWIEGSSNEDVTSDNILELWARLLANSSSEFDARFLAYNDALRKIGPKEALIINRFIQPRYITGLRSGSGSEFFRWCTTENCTHNCEKLVSLYFGKLKDNEIPLPSVINHKDIRKCSRIIGRLLDGHLISFHISSDSSGLGTGEIDGVAEVLEHAGLVKIHERDFKADNGTKIELRWGVPTAIGLGLYFEINRDRLSVSRDHLDSDEFEKYGIIEQRIPERLLMLIQSGND